MPRRHPSVPNGSASEPALSPLSPVGLVAATGSAHALTPDDVLIRLAEAEDTLRAISAGEVDALVMPDEGDGRQVFTLSTADRPYRMFVENMRDGAATVSADGLILYANRRLAELLSCRREAIVGAPLARFVASDSPFWWQEIASRGGAGLTTEVDLIDVEGLLVPVLIGASPLELEGVQLMCITFTDLTAQRAQDREISRLGVEREARMADLQTAQAALTLQATHDRLTGLPNRSLVMERIHHALTYAERTGHCTAVFFVDVDRFKQVNDTHGHAAGDAVLRSVADELVAAVRPEDTVARIGGDEFVVLAPAVRSHDHAVELGTRLICGLNDRPDGSDGVPQATVSIGIAISTGGGGTAEILLNEADTAMYRAKALGGARAMVFDAALGLQVQQWTDAKRILSTALDEDRVIAHYQPIIDLQSGTVAGFEALARIAEGDKVLPPSAFISVAEETGLVIPLGSRMLDLCCAEGADWESRTDPVTPLSVAVNLSGRQFRGGDLVAVVEAALEASGLAPTALHLEITETAIMDLHPETLKQLRALTDKGIEIGLDDFGTGYASLTHLRRLPLAFVKIDQTFVAGVETNQEDERIVAAVVDLAANLGLRSIAEGVETRGQLDMLREFGCDQAQGYLISRPMPADAIPGALAALAP
ncbi:MAG TPA: EAL domain-containing protein [Iamia sp.]|nr:EAL domain-containing protein [Iamia sp.]